MNYPAKERQCDCGNTLVVDRKRVWCKQCGKPVYHNPKQQRLHKFNNVYFVVIIALVMGFMAFLFIEVIAIPLFNVQMP